MSTKTMKISAQLQTHILVLVVQPIHHHDVCAFLRIDLFPGQPLESLAVFLPWSGRYIPDARVDVNIRA